MVTGTIFFEQQGAFAAFNAAKQWCQDRGYAVGKMQRTAPTGIKLGDWAIEKWDNLDAAERAGLDGRIEGDKYNGPITVTIKAQKGPIAGEGRTMTHTPGPLVVRRAVYGMAGSYTEWQISPGRAITPIGCAYDEADARLWAASPGSLDALRHAYDEVYEHHSGADWTGELLDRLGVAIEAATGVHPQESLRGR